MTERGREGKRNREREDGTREGERKEVRERES